MKEETIQFKQNLKKKKDNIFEKGADAGQDEKGKLGKALGTKSGV